MDSPKQHCIAERSRIVIFATREKVHLIAMSGGRRGEERRENNEAIETR